MLNLSQQDYVHRIDELNQALIDAWQHDQRVKALKIVIQVNYYYINHLLMLDSMIKGQSTQNGDPGKLIIN